MGNHKRRLPLSGDPMKVWSNPRISKQFGCESGTRTSKPKNRWKPTRLHDSSWFERSDERSAFLEKSLWLIYIIKTFCLQVLHHHPLSHTLPGTTLGHPAFHLKLMTVRRVGHVQLPADHFLQTSSSKSVYMQCWRQKSLGLSRKPVASGPLNRGSSLTSSWNTNTYSSIAHRRPICKSPRCLRPSP